MTLETMFANKASILNAKPGNALLAEIVADREAADKQRLKSALSSASAQISRSLEDSVYHMRNYKKIAEKAVKTVKDIDAAKKYFEESGNPLPYYKATNHASGGVYFLREVGLDPDDFPVDGDAWKIPATA